MIEIPVWAFVLMIIAFVVMYVGLMLKFWLDSPEKESNESLSEELELERRKARELRDESAMWCHRYKCLFEEKADVAEQKGALGIIVYNNVSGDIKMNVGDAKLGACSISQADGEILAAAKIERI